MNIPRLRKQLLAWYAAHRRDLPWRQTREPYAIWLSEVMLQQTRVAAVIPYYEKFLTLFPSVEALAAAPEQIVARGLGWAGLLFAGAELAASGPQHRRTRRVPEYL